MSDADLTASFGRFGESVAEYAFSRVREALELERDRHEAEIEVVRAELKGLRAEIRGAQLVAVPLNLAQHSVKVIPAE